MYPTLNFLEDKTSLIKFLVEEIGDFKRDAIKINRTYRMFIRVIKIDDANANNFDFIKRKVKKGFKSMRYHITNRNPKRFKGKKMRVSLRIERWDEDFINDQFSVLLEIITKPC